MNTRQNLLYDESMTRMLAWQRAHLCLEWSWCLLREIRSRVKHDVDEGSHGTRLVASWVCHTAQAAPQGDPLHLQGMQLTCLHLSLNRQLGDECHSQVASNCTLDGFD